jgi:hypothetical protein
VGPLIDDDVTVAGKGAGKGGTLTGDVVGATAEALDTLFQIFSVVACTQGVEELCQPWQVALHHCNEAAIDKEKACLEANCDKEVQVVSGRSLDVYKCCREAAACCHAPVENSLHECGMKIPMGNVYSPPDPSCTAGPAGCRKNVTVQFDE